MELGASKFWVRKNYSRGLQNHVSRQMIDNSSYSCDIGMNKYTRDTSDSPAYNCESWSVGAWILQEPWRAQFLLLFSSFRILATELTIQSFVVDTNWWYEVALYWMGVQQWQHPRHCCTNLFGQSERMTTVAMKPRPVSAIYRKGRQRQGQMTVLSWRNVWTNAQTALSAIPPRSNIAPYQPRHTITSSGANRIQEDTNIVGKNGSGIAMGVLDRNPRKACRGWDFRKMDIFDIFLSFHIKTRKIH